METNAYEPSQGEERNEDMVSEEEGVGTDLEHLSVSNERVPTYGSEPEALPMAMEEEEGYEPVSEEAVRTAEEQALPFTSFAGKYETTVFFDPQTVAKAGVVHVSDPGTGWKSKVGMFSGGSELKEAYLVLQPHALFWFKNKHSVKARQVFVLDSYLFETPPGSYIEGQYPLDVVQKSRYYTYRFYMPDESTRQEWASALQEQSLERWKRWTMTEKKKADKMAFQLSEALRSMEALRFQLSKAEEEKNDTLQVLESMEASTLAAEERRAQAEDALNEKISELETHLQEKSDEADSLDRDLGEAAAELNALTAKLEDKEAVHAELESKVQELTRSHEERSLLLSKSDAMLAAKEAELEEIKNVLKETEEIKRQEALELASHREELKAKETRLSTLQEEQADIQKQLEASGALVQSLQLTVTGLNAAVREAEAEQSKLRVAEARLLTKLDMLEKALATGKEEKEEVMKKLQCAEEESKESQIAAARVQAEMGRLLDKQEAHNKEDSKLVEELFEEKRTADKLRIDLDAASTSMQQLQSTIVSQTAKIEALRHAAESKEADIASLKEQTRAEQQRCSLLEAKLTDYNGRIAALQAENLSISEEFRKARATLLEKTDTVERLEARTSAYDSFSTKQSHEMQTMQMLLAKARSEIHYMEASLNSKSFELEELRRSMENGTSTREQLLAENSRLLGESRMLQDKNARLSAEKNEMRVEIGGKESKLKALESLQSLLAEREEEIRGLKERLAAKSAEVDSMASKHSWDRPPVFVSVPPAPVPADTSTKLSLQRMQEDNDQLHSKLRETEQEIDALRKQMAKATEAQLLKEQKNAQSETKRLKAAQKEADGMREELLALQAKNQSTQALEKEYGEILEEIHALERREHERQSEISAVKAAGIAQNAQIEALNAKLAQAYSILDSKIDKLNLQEKAKVTAKKAAPAPVQEDPPRVVKKTVKKKAAPESMIPQAVSYGQYRGTTPTYGAKPSKARSTF